MYTSEFEQIDLDLVLQAAGKLTGLGYSEMQTRFAAAEEKTKGNKEKALILFLEGLHDLIKEE